MFNIIVLSAGLNDNSNESYTIVPSTLWIFNISFDTAFSLNLPLISTALIKTLVSIPTCEIDKATLTSVFD